MTIIKNTLTKHLVIAEFFAASCFCLLGGDDGFGKGAIHFRTEL